MHLYHGSYTQVEKPDISHSRVNVDFGPGFYTTPIRDQAARWCNKFISKNGQAFISQYEFDEAAFADLKILQFGNYNQQWLDFVLDCRSGKDVTDFDIVAGGVANDKVFNTVELYFKGLIDKAEALKRLQYEKPNQQFAFRSQNAIGNYLSYLGSEKIC